MAVAHNEGELGGGGGGVAIPSQHKADDVLLQANVLY